MTSRAALQAALTASRADASSRGPIAAVGLCGRVLLTTVDRAVPVSRGASGPTARHDVDDGEEAPVETSLRALEAHVTRLALECTAIECTPGLTQEQLDEAVATAVEVHGPIQAALAGDPDEVGNALALMALSAAKNLAGCVVEAAARRGLDPVELLADVREQLERG